MKFYFAPMEGITGYIYRNVYEHFFSNIDKYFTPFIAPNQNRCFNTREKKDILPEHNKNMIVVPQILTNRAKDFIWTAKELEKLGYKEVNLNLGCPSNTVVSKGRGSGFLARREELQIFLDQIFRESNIRISIKTRIGKDSPEEWNKLIEIYNKYPLEELIIHPRIQKDFYNNKPNLSVFKEALSKSKNPVCYNGDLFTKKLFEEFQKDFPEVEMVMIGRGILVNPELIDNIKQGKETSKGTLKRFHDCLYEEYKKELSGDKNILFKMKEFWYYFSHSFTNSEKYMKKIKKSEKLNRYEEAVESLFQEQDLVWK